MINVLVTTAGSVSGVNCINALKQQNEIEVKIIASDVDIFAPGLYLADKRYIVPPFEREDMYIDTIIDICSKEHVDVVIPVFSNDVYLFAKYENRLRESNVNFYISPFQTVDLFMNKWRSYQFFLNNDIPTLETHRLSDANKIDFPIFVKPIVGSGSRNTLRINTKNELGYFISTVNSSHYICQPFTMAPEFTVEILVGAQNKIVALVARQRLKTKGGLAVVSQTVDQAPFLPIIRSIFSRITFRGPINIQFFIPEDSTPLVSEINTRLAAGGSPLTRKVCSNFPLETIKFSLGLETSSCSEYAIGVTMMRYYTEIFV